MHVHICTSTHASPTSTVYCTTPTNTLLTPLVSLAQDNNLTRREGKCRHGKVQYCTNMYAPACAFVAMSSPISSFLNQTFHETEETRETQPWNRYSTVGIEPISVDTPDIARFIHDPHQTSTSPHTTFHTCRGHAHPSLYSGTGGGRVDRFTRTSETHSGVSRILGPWWCLLFGSLPRVVYRLVIPTTFERRVSTLPSTTTNLR